jgi:hypothetical protein
VKHFQKIISKIFTCTLGRKDLTFISTLHITLEEPMITFESHLIFSFKNAVITHVSDIIDVASIKPENKIGKLTVKGISKKVTPWKDQEWRDKTAAAEKLWETHGHGAHALRCKVAIISGLAILLFAILAAITASISIPAMAVFVGLAVIATVVSVTFLAINIARRHQFKNVQREFCYQHIVRIQIYVADTIKKYRPNWLGHHDIVFVSETIDKFCMGKYTECCKKLDRIADKILRQFPDKKTCQQRMQQLKSEFERHFLINEALGSIR